jgi:hypothetical protein
MRCQKCGFIGFDHLSECSVCGDDLSSSREKLGLLPRKPAAPFFLGALLKDYQGAPLNQVNEPPRIDPVVSSIPEIEFGDELELSGESPDFGLGSVSPGVPSMAMSSPGAAPDPFDGAMMIDLSDDDLDPAKDGKMAGEIELDLDFLLEGESSVADGDPTVFGSADKKNGDSAGTLFDMPIGGPDSATLELTDADLDQITSESEPADDLNGSSSDDASHEFGNMVLDLSDDDLHKLISDLE